MPPGLTTLAISFLGVRHEMHDQRGHGNINRLVGGEGVFHLMGRDQVVPAKLADGARLHPPAQVTYPRQLLWITVVLSFLFVAGAQRPHKTDQRAFARSQRHQRRDDAGWKQDRQVVAGAGASIEFNNQEDYREYQNDQ